MDPLKVIAILATGLMLSGCAGALDGLSASSGQDAYTMPGYYGTPAYPAPDGYGQPGYAAPSYQPGYVTPYIYEGGSERGGDSWRQHEWRERRDHAFQNDGREPLGQQRQDVRHVPQMTAQPRSMVPAAPSPRMAPQPPPAARPQADQNKKLLDQLGFRPSR